jgi:protein gp37
MPDHPPEVAALLKRDGTGISWADFTFNPWIGCQKVGPPCDNCYAEDLFGTEGSRLKRVVWGPDGERLMTSPANWAKPLRWQKILMAAGVFLDVFSASLADWADNKAPAGARAQLALVIRRTPNLRWMLLTKRIGNAEAMLREMFPEGVPPNVALGITVALQNEVDRDIPRAIEVKKRLGIRALFLSMEPLLGPVYLDPAWLRDIDLVIVGGESGKNARPMHPVWALEIGDQCWKAGVRFHFKQWGEYVEWTGAESPSPSYRFPDGFAVVWVGTKKAGRVIAGREWQDRLAA